MLRKKAKKRKIKKITEISRDNISAHMLTEIVNLAPSSFFVLVYGDNRKSKLSDTILDSGQQFVSQITMQKKHRILINTNIIFFEKIIPWLNETESVAIYIPFGSVTFEQFIYNCVNGSEYLFNKCIYTVEQKSAIEKQLCYFTCIWAAEKNRIRFFFDDFQGAEMFKKLEMIWERE